MVSHASNPTAEPLDGGRIRVYFGTRDAGNRSRIAAAVFELEPEPRLLDLGPRALVEPGAPGLFDDSGASMGCLAPAGGVLLLYYVGWNLGVTVPWRNSIGIAVSRDGGVSFQKNSEAPALDRNGVDPYSLSYPWILDDGGRLRMWYGSNLRWGATGRDMDHVIKHAESADGLAWTRDGRVVLPLSGPDEYALCRPCVVRDRDCFRMWFSHRGAGYRIGYAESPDGLSWTREASGKSLDASGAGWDSEMVCYPCVFDCRGARYMLYNGNGYGRSGIGLARLE
jgi:hypothetical protein